MQPSDVAQVEAVLALLQRNLSSGVVGIYLYGSALLGGLRASSDLDLLVVVDGPTTPSQRGQLVADLLRRSGRPVEVTVVRLDQLQSLRPLLEREFQYGEWLRADYVSGHVPAPTADPDLLALLATALTASEPLSGPQIRDLLDPIPRDDLVASMRLSLPSLLADLADDPRNVLLTLARMWHTAETGEVVSKDVAAFWALARMPVDLAAPLAIARAVYLEEANTNTFQPALADKTADLLVSNFTALAERGFLGGPS